jgi:Uma2 family endonuclease
MTTQPQPARMTADEFLVWAEGQPHRYELVNGEVAAMAPERLEHTRTKLEATIALRAAISERRLDCEAMIDGVGVRVDETTVYEPDVLVRCGDRLPGGTTEVVDPMILIEVVSPSTRSVDSGVKLTDYFRLPSVRHYLVVNTSARAITHHRRGEGGNVETRIVRNGPISLDPPGIELAAEQIFAAL